MPNRFEYTDPCGDDLTAAPHKLNDGTPAVLVMATEHDGENVVAEATVFIPLDRLEEVIAGLRDIARQAGAQADPCSGCRHVPCGTCTPAAGAPPVPLPGAPITDEQYAHAAAVLPPGARITAQALRAAEEAGA